MTRRLFARLAAAAIVGLSLNLPLGQRELSYELSGEDILRDVMDMVSYLESVRYGGPYLLIISDKMYREVFG